MPAPRAALLLGASLGAALTACEDSARELPCGIDFEPESESAPLYLEPTPCDPRVSPATTPRLQPPVVVGVADDSTIYVIDRLDGGFGRPELDGRLVPRIFIEDNGVLVRKQGGVGSSQATADYLYDSFGAIDPDISGIVRVRRKPGYPLHIIPSETSMVIFDTPPTGGPYLSDSFDEGTSLRVLSECAVADYAVRDLPQARHIAYVAEDEAGNEILVTVPDVDWDVQSCKLFYGAPDAVRERPVRSFSRERDGGTTHIAFLIDGVEATLHFWYGCNGPFTGDCEGTLELPETTLTVSIPSTDEAMLVGNTYVCHDQLPPP